VPDFERRLDVMEKLALRGWSLGLRFDPLFATPGFAEHFEAMIEELRSRLPIESIHSVSLGLFRMPREFHRRIERLYPEEPLLAVRLEASSEDDPNLLTFPEPRARELLERCTNSVTTWLPAERLFPCS
jgi:spore photoproduct lyase